MMANFVFLSLTQETSSKLEVLALRSYRPQKWHQNVQNFAVKPRATLFNFTSMVYKIVDVRQLLSISENEFSMVSIQKRVDGNLFHALSR